MYHVPLKTWRLEKGIINMDKTFLWCLHFATYSFCENMFFWCVDSNNRDQFLTYYQNKVTDTITFVKLFLNFITDTQS